MKCIKRINFKIDRFFQHKSEIKKQKDKRRVLIAKSIKLSKTQKKQIDSFFKTNYGKKINYRWHKLYTAISGRFDYRFFPEYLYTSGFQMLSNSPDYYRSLADKNLLPLLIKGSGLDVKVLKSIFSCSNGLILNEQNEQVSITAMIEKLKQFDSFFIKPSVDSNSGRGCNLYLTDKQNGDVEKLISSYDKNYVIQERLVSQDDISKLNPSSLNTFRVITYILDGEVYASPIILRIGRNGNTCDNAHAGGLFVAVSNVGQIISDGKTEFNEQVKVHPDSNITFKGYKIKNVDKIPLAAKKVASLIPQVGVIDWDFTIDKNGNPVIVEANTFGGSVWLIQMSHGESVFGENTARVLQIIRKNKILY